MSKSTLAIAFAISAVMGTASVGPASSQEATEQRLGAVHFPTSCNETAQRRFDRAMRYQHSFWYRASREIFDDVLKADADCAIAYWGIAQSLLLNPFGVPPAGNLAEGLAAIEKGKVIGAKTPRENDFIDALGAFYADHGKLDHRTRVRAYLEAMAALAQRYPQDDEAQIYYALALVVGASPADKTYANQLKAAAILEGIFKRQPQHPGVAHYLIHSYDYPPIAGQGLDAAKRYSAIAPSAPHAQHMPSHIFTRVGYWKESIAANAASVRAARADKEYGDQLHGQDYMVYAYLQLAQDNNARVVVEEMAAATGVNPNAAGANFAVAASPARYMVERGDWAGAAQLQVRPSRFAHVMAITHFARALGAARAALASEASGQRGGSMVRAHSASEDARERADDTRPEPGSSARAGKPDAANADIAKLAELRDQLRAGNDAYWSEQVDIQWQGAGAWLLYAEGKHDEALKAMTAAAAAEDKTEKSPVTPGPLAPARELLGAMLLERGMAKEAVAAFEATLKKEPNRLGATIGAAKAAERAGDLGKARQHYAAAVALAEGADPVRIEVAQARAFVEKAHPSIEQRVDAFVSRLEERRIAQGVVGAAVVIAQGDRIVRATGLGRRSVESPDPVTDETVFALGSVTKQFTAMAVALTVSDGKMAFEDHPRRYVPSFRLQDPEADAKLNMIDLLAHRSGLDRSDVTWLLAPFTQEEMFELAHRSRPAAQLRERFLYNNTMYALAGAAAARAQQTTYEGLMTERLLRPIGMSSSTLTLAALMASPNRAIGYGRFTAGQPALMKPVDLASVAPAGALNSTARDMGAWLRFLNSRGRINGEAKIAPAAFARLFEQHQQTSHSSHYGLGFFLQTRSGVQVAEHGGNVPGYTAQVVHVPDRALSFALLTNQDNSQLGAIAQELFWDVVVGPEVAAAPSVTASPPASPEPKSGGETATPPRPIAPERLTGHYFAFSGGAFEVRTGGNGPIAVFSGQPPYPLRATGINAFDLSGLSGFSLSFAESSAMPGRITAFLRQPPSHPAGNIDFLKKDDAWLARAKAQHGGPDKELIGSYRSDDQTMIMEIVPYQGGVALIITGQTPWLLKALGADLYQLDGLPETYRIRAKRSSDGRVLGFTLNQPNLSLEMTAATSTAAGNADEARRVLDRAVAAVGGAEALDGIATMSSIGRASAPTHGLDGRVEDHVSSGKRAELIELGAFGKTVFNVAVVTSGPRSFMMSRGGEQRPASGKALLLAQLLAVPHPLYRWKERFATVAAAGQASIGGEDAFVIELTPKDLAPSRLYISTGSFLVLREEIPSYSGDELQPTSMSTDYSDYRVVSGVRLPFAASAPVPLLGRVAAAYDSVSVNNPIDPKVFDEPPR